MTVPTYYWKALHLPSDQYLLNHIAGSTLHTNHIGSKWSTREEVESILRNKGNKFVRGPITIKFDKNDWELQEYIVSLRNTVRLSGPTLLGDKAVASKIRRINKVKNYGNHPFFVKKAEKAKVLLNTVGLPEKFK